MRDPELRTLALDRVGGGGTVIVDAAIEPHPAIPTLLNTGGRGTEFARSVVLDRGGPGPERLGASVSGADVLGERVGAAILAVGGVRIAVDSLAVRDGMEDPQGMVGMDVLRGTVLGCTADPAGRVVWQLPPDRYLD